MAFQTRRLGCIKSKHSIALGRRSHHASLEGYIQVQVHPEEEDESPMLINNTCTAPTLIKKKVSTSDHLYLPRSSRRHSPNDNGPSEDPPSEKPQGVKERAHLTDDEAFGGSVPGASFGVSCLEVPY